MQHFDSDSTAKLPISGSEDRGHSALSDSLLDLISTNEDVTGDNHRDSLEDGDAISTMMLIDVTNVSTGSGVPRSGELTSRLLSSHAGRGRC
jgi:hypothetical protein